MSVIRELFSSNKIYHLSVLLIFMPLCMNCTAKNEGADGLSYRNKETRETIELVHDAREPLETRSVIYFRDGHRGLCIC